MAFPTKVIPFSDACVTWLNQTYAPKEHEHDQYLTSADIVGGFDSMPDYNRTVLLKEPFTITENNKGFPIFKINVPGYLQALGPNVDFNQDTFFYLSDNPVKLIDKTAYTDKFTVISGMCSDADSGGCSSQASIYPGSSTYMSIGGRAMGYHVIFTPCIGVSLLIPTARYVVETEYNVVENNAMDMINGDDKLYMIRPGSEAWKRLFNNNWKANFPDLTL